MNILETPSIQTKIEHLRHFVDDALNQRPFQVPHTPARDIQVLSVKETRSNKLGFSSSKGVGSMLHLTANIELQAMEMGIRSLIEFPDAPEQFRKNLADVVLEEGEHLQLCLAELEALGYKWGDWPINFGLWNSTDPSDSLLDRILIVHCFLEGSGLDAQEKILRRLSGVNQKPVSQLMQKIFLDEKKHVNFGIHSYKICCDSEGLDPDLDFKSRAQELFLRLPKRFEKPNYSLRREIGFSEAQAKAISDIHDRQVKIPFHKSG